MHSPPLRTHRPGLLLLVIALQSLCACQGENPPTSVPPPQDSTHTTDSIAYADAATLCTIADARLTEISGIASSRLRDGVFWLHNDSGGEPRLFAIDSNGVTLASCLLDGAVNRDWEDIASVTLEGISWLYVGDIGDNDRKYGSVTVYRIREPVVHATSRDSMLSGTPERAVFRYPDGSRDCEALMVDPRDGSVVLVEKSGDTTGVYAAQWPADGGEAFLQRVAAFRPPVAYSFARQITAADMHPTSRSVVLRTYTALLEYRIPQSRPTSVMFDSANVVILSTPGLLQTEAACYSRNGRDLLTTSEGSRPPLLILRRRN